MAAKNHPSRRKRAYGGKIDKKAETTFNAQGSPEQKDAHKTKGDGFKRGGHVEGEKSEMRLDKRARGGHVGHKNRTRAMGKYAAGGSPMSSAHSLSAPDKSGSGHEGESVKEEP